MSNAKQRKNISIELPKEEDYTSQIDELNKIQEDAKRKVEEEAEAKRKAEEDAEAKRIAEEKARNDPELGKKGKKILTQRIGLLVDVDTKETLSDLARLNKTTVNKLVTELITDYINANRDRLK